MRARKRGGRRGLCVPAGDRHGLGHVGAPEDGTVDHDDVHLVEAGALAPAVLQGRGLVIGGEYAFVVRTAEDREGGEVLLGVATLRGGVDEDGPFGGPHDVAAPQVTVGAGGADVALARLHLFDEARLPVVERARFEAFAELVDERSFRGREDAVVEVGGDPLTRVEGAPGFTFRRGRGRARLTGQREVGLPHPAITSEAGRRRTQVAGSGSVRVGEGSAEFFCGPRSRCDGDQARLLKPRRTVIENGHDDRAGVRGLGEPRKARNLVGDPPAAAVRFPDGVHRCGLLSHNAPTLTPERLDDHRPAIARGHTGN